MGEVSEIAVKRLLKEITPMYEALRYYADLKRWRPNSYGIISAHEDRGERARVALKTLEPKP
jgi:hypothetical protein